MEKRKQNRRVRHRAQRQGAELRDLELRSHAPEGSSSKAKERAPFWKVVRLLALVLLVAGGVELGVAALTSPRFKVAEVSVSGAQVTPPEEVAAIQQTLVGQNWVRAKTSAAQKQLLAIPTVKEAHIVRALHWPPSLHISLEERAPFARVGAGGDWWIVDENGVPFRRAQKEDENFYALTGPNLQPQLGAPLPKNEWQNCARLVRALNGAGSAQDGSTPAAKWSLRRVYFDKNGFAALRLKGGAQDELLIRLGGDRWEEKLARAQMALAYFARAGKRAQSLNLVSYNVPQWTPLQPAADAGSTPGTNAGA